MTQINCDKKGVHRTSYYLHTPDSAAAVTADTGANSNIYAWPAQQAAPVWQAATVGQTESVPQTKSASQSPATIILSQTRGVTG